MILILKTGSTIDNIISRYGDFEDWITDRMELVESDYIVHSAGNYDILPPDSDYTGIVITGSPLMVTEMKLDDSRLCNWLLDKQNNEVPILGICFGHQLLNIINGGSVSNNGSGIIIGSQSTYLTGKGKEDELLGSLPEILNTFKTHEQCIDKPPESAVILSTNNSGIIDAIRFKPKSWGVQFHPEFDSNIMNLYIENKRDYLISRGYNIEVLLSRTGIIDFGGQILNRFKEIVNTGK